MEFWHFFAESPSGRRQNESSSSSNSSSTSRPSKKKTRSAKQKKSKAPSGNVNIRESAQKKLNKLEELNSMDAYYAYSFALGWIGNFFPPPLNSVFNGIKSTIDISKQNEINELTKNILIGHNQSLMKLSKEVKELYEKNELVRKNLERALDALEERLISLEGYTYGLTEARKSNKKLLLNNM